MTAATSSALETESAAMPLSASQNAGNWRVPKTSTVTLRVSRRSSVARMSRIDLTPAETTVIGAAGEDPEVGRLVERLAGVAVHAPDAAGGEYADPGL